MRLKVYFNKKGVSVIENRYKALMLVKDKYVMLFNNRGIANHKYLNEIIDFLKKDEYSFVHVDISKTRKNKNFF